MPLLSLTEIKSVLDTAGQQTAAILLISSFVPVFLIIKAVDTGNTAWIKKRPLLIDFSRSTSPIMYWLLIFSYVLMLGIIAFLLSTHNVSFGIFCFVDFFAGMSIFFYLERYAKIGGWGGNINRDSEPISYWMVMLGWLIALLYMMCVVLKEAL